MKRFFAFVKKEYLHIFRDYRTVLILFGMPIVQILLFGYAINNELRSARIAIFDKSHDVYSARLIEKINATGYFEIEEFLNSETEIDAELKKGIIKGVLTIDADFAKKIALGAANLQLILDASDPNIANLILNYIANIVNKFKSEISIADSQTQSFIVETRMLYNQELKSVFMFIPGLIAVILMLVSALMTSITIAREKELGTMEILLASPLKPYQIIIGKVMPYILLAFANAIVILLLARFVFKMPINGSIVLLLSECFLFIITSLSLGVMISTITSSQQTAMMISLVALMMPTMLLSGYIFPIDNMPEILQILTNAIPAKWFIIIIKNIMLKSAKPEFIYKETIILAGMALLFITISIKKFKIRY